MTVAELRKALKGVKGTENIHVRLNEGNKKIHYSIRGISKDANFKEYVINIGTDEF